MPQQSSGLGQFEHYQFGFGSVYGSHARGGAVRGQSYAPPALHHSAGVGGTVTPYSFAPMFHGMQQFGRAAVSPFLRGRSRSFGVGQGTAQAEETDEAGAAPSVGTAPTVGAPVTQATPPPGAPRNRTDSWRVGQTPSGLWVPGMGESPY